MQIVNSFIQEQICRVYIVRNCMLVDTQWEHLRQTVLRFGSRW